MAESDKDKERPKPIPGGSQHGKLIGEKPPAHGNVVGPVTGVGDSTEKTSKKKGGGKHRKPK